jgi:hypothetical protein
MSRPTMTVAEAQAAGLLDGTAPRKGKRKTREAYPRDGAESHCVTHDERFTRDVDENRHVAAHSGCRIESEMV